MTTQILGQREIDRVDGRPDHRSAVNGKPEAHPPAANRAAHRDIHQPAKPRGDGQHEQAMAEPPVKPGPSAPDDRQRLKRCAEGQNSARDHVQGNPDIGQNAIVVEDTRYLGRVPGQQPAQDAMQLMCGYDHATYVAFMPARMPHVSSGKLLEYQFTAQDAPLPEPDSSNPMDLLT